MPAINGYRLQSRFVSQRISHRAGKASSSCRFSGCCRMPHNPLLSFSTGASEVRRQIGVTRPGTDETGALWYESTSCSKSISKTQTQQSCCPLSPSRAGSHSPSFPRPRDPARAHLNLHLSDAISPHSGLYGFAFFGQVSTFFALHFEFRAVQTTRFLSVSTFARGQVRLSLYKATAGCNKDL
jgi:hypothetical protein